MGSEMCIRDSLIIAEPLRADMANTIAKVKPSVVMVGTYKNTNSPRFALRGTGFVVTNENSGRGNLVITNAHVLELPAKVDVDAALVIQVRGEQNELQMRPVTVLEVDTPHDLVLLRFEGPSAPALSMRDSGLAREWQAVAFMGFPIGGALGLSLIHI